MPTQSNLDLAKAKLASSGLPEEAIAALHLDVLSAAETAAIAPHFPAAPAIRIRYMDPFTKRETAQPLRHHPRYPGFERIRIIGPDVLGRDGKPLRYLQAKDIGVCAYFPSLIDWAPVLEDSDYDLVITEGEFKSAKATAMGIYSIGLGGANNIYSKKTGCGFLPELQRINWAHRKTYICFDNDGQPKPSVIEGTNALAHELLDLGAIVYMVRLPDPAPGKKMGLDDYLLTHTRDDFQKLKDDAEAMVMAEELWRMNERAVKVRTPKCIVDLSDSETLNMDVFLAHYNNRKVPEQVLNNQNEMSRKRVALAVRWLEWPYRNSVRGLTYAPGQPRYLGDGDEFNMWGGWGSTPTKGDVTPFLKLLNYIFGDSKEGKEAQRWFLQWCAYPIQYPGMKLYTAVLLWSREHGTGKTLLGYVLGKIYGEKNWSEVRQKALLSDFNSWAKNKQLIIGTEITGSDKNQHADELKDLITSERLPINEKYIPEYTLPNVANFFLNSNRDSALFLEDDDRRFFVWEVQSKAPDEFFDTFDKWYKTPSNIAAVHHYLHTFDTKAFKPYSRAMVTKAKEDMTSTTRADHQRWCHQVRDSPDYYLKGRSSDLYTAEEMLEIYRQKDQNTFVKAAGFGSALRAAKFIRLEQIRWGNPSKADRFYIIRNEEKWKKATTIQIRKHLETTKPQPSPLAAQYKG